MSILTIEFDRLNRIFNSHAYACCDDLDADACEVFYTVLQVVRPLFDLALEGDFKVTPLLHDNPALTAPAVDTAAGYALFVASLRLRILLPLLGKRQFNKEMKALLATASEYLSPATDLEALTTHNPALVEVMQARLEHEYEQ